MLQRTIAAALGLIAFDWLWGALTELVRLITTSLLSLPWVADGVRRMLQTLVIGGAGGTAVAAEFVVPLILAVAGAVLLALMLLRVGLEVIAALVYATGGLALGLSVSGGGARLLQAWTIAATAVFVLPVVWCVVFVCGAALMLDAGTSTSGGGFGDFVAQLYNIGAALVTFGIAIKLARAILGHAGTAMTGLAVGARFSGGGGRGLTPAMAGAGARGTPQSLARFSQRLRGSARGSAVGMARVGAFPVRHPVQAAAHARHPVQATQAAAQHVRTSTKDGAAAAGTGNRQHPEPGQGHQGGNGGSRSSNGQRSQPRSAPGDAAQAAGPMTRRAATTRPRRSDPASRPGTPPARSPVAPPVGTDRPAARPPATTTQSGADTPPPAHVEGAIPRTTAPAATAKAWRTARRVVAPARPSKKPTPKRDRKRP